MTERWRLIDGKELYDIVSDPGQQKNIAEDHSNVVKRLRGDYEKWWTSLAPAVAQTVRYGLGGAENPTTLASHDWLMPGVKQIIRFVNRDVLICKLIKRTNKLNQITQLRFWQILYLQRQQDILTHCAPIHQVCFLKHHPHP